MKKIPAPVKKIPAPVKIALRNALKNQRTPKETKAVLTSVLATDGNVSFRFQPLPDEARQVIRKAVIADCKAFTYGSMTACAIAYDVTPPNVLKWLREDREGIKVTRTRGRKKGTPNTWSHKQDRWGNTILVPFKSKKMVRVVRKVDSK